LDRPVGSSSFRFHFTKLVAGVQDFNYNDRLKMLGLQRLEERRMKSDVIETFKIVNRKYDINPELFFSAR